MIDLSSWRKAWTLLDARERRNAWIVLAIIILAALSSAVMVGSIMPFLSVLADPNRIREAPALAWAYEAGGFETDYDFLVALGVASLAVIVAASLVQILRTWAVARFATMRAHTLSHRLLAAYLRQPYEYFLDRHTGEMSTQILAESQQVVNLFFSPAAEVVAALLTIIAIITVLVWVNPLVAFIAFAALGVLYGATFLLSRKLIARQGHVRAEANRARFRLASEALGGVKDIKLLGREGAYVHRYRDPSQRMARSAVVMQVLGEVPQYIMQAVGFGGIVILCLLLLDPDGLASGAALGGILPLLGVFAFAGQRMLPEFSRLYRGLTQLTYGAAAVDTIQRDLSAKTVDVTLPLHLPAPLGLKTALSLDRVTYRYPHADHVGLQDISLTIEAGEKIGVVGSTGAGKTTLGDIVLGHLRPSEGRLVVDGTEITEGNLRSWQQTLGYVPQDIFLTDASVAENIALGLAPNESDPECVRRAARIAQIDRFIREELPKGYETLVGERGVRLSGGQRQRIGIARALYHDADLIVFDEATSALDNLTEAELMAAIKALPGDKTILMIAHRLSTVKVCDRIAVLEKGRLVGLGSWAELMSDNATFQKIAQLSEAA